MDLHVGSNAAVGDRDAGPDGHPSATGCIAERTAAGSAPGSTASTPCPSRPFTVMTLVGKVSSLISGQHIKAPACGQIGPVVEREDRYLRPAPALLADIRVFGVPALHRREVP